MQSLLDFLAGKQNDPAALVAGIEAWAQQREDQATAQLQAAIDKINADAQARIGQVLDGVATTMLEVRALVSRLDGATMTTTVKLGGEGK